MDERAPEIKGLHLLRGAAGQWPLIGQGVTHKPPALQGPVGSRPLPNRKARRRADPEHDASLLKTGRPLSQRERGWVEVSVQLIADQLLVGAGLGAGVGAVAGGDSAFLRRITNGRGAKPNWMSCSLVKPNWPLSMAPIRLRRLSP